MNAQSAALDLPASAVSPTEEVTTASPALLPALVARQAARTPDAIAVSDHRRQLSYRELDRRANQLAYVLRSQGVGRETLVGVALSRSAELAVALLAIWRAGGAYVPLDTRHPADRVRWIVADTGTRLVLTDDSAGNVFAGTRARPMNLDGLWNNDDGLPDGPPDSGVDGDNAAYVIYTSGSTGRPKGVVVRHAGIANRVLWTVERHQLGAADRVLQKTALGFDAACWEFFAPLISGGTIVMAPAGVERDPAAMVKTILDERITVIQGVPSVLRLLVAEPGWADCGSLRLVFSAGEPLHGSLAVRLAVGPAVQVWNTYGPTECSIDVTGQQYDAAQGPGPVPIGRPIANMRALVLDPDGDPVPVGVAGELHAGGAGLARGYLNSPLLTADRFVPDPYGAPGERLYRTGDIVRWRGDDTLEFLGRLDDQLKINGVRIEPGEVAAALLTHPDVLAAEVLSHTAPDGGRQLVGYVVARRAVPTEELRVHLRDRLPAPFIPAVFVALEAFPLTANGKVDRSALPTPASAIHDGRPSRVAPRNRAEEIVSAVWSDLLGVADIGVHDDFFALGGESLMLTRLAGRLHAASGGRVDLRGLFDASTVEGQARLLTIDSAPTESHSEVPLLDRAHPLPLSFGQHRLWFLDQLNPGGNEWVAPVFLRIPADVATSTVRTALEALAGRHESLRTRYVLADGEPRQLIEPAGSVELRETTATPGDLVGLFGEQFDRGFSLTDGPLWRALLVRLPGQDHVLLITVHHIASDGWSAVVLERETRELCIALHEHRSAVLPALSVQYADYAGWQRDRLTDDVVAADLRYWRRNLAGLEPAEPADRSAAADGPRPPRVRRAGAAATGPRDRCRGTGPAVRHHALHDGADRLRRHARQAQRPDRVRPRHPVGRSHAAGVRQRGRAVPEPGRTALRSVRQPDLPRRAGPDSGDLPGGLRTPDRSVRAPRR